MLNDIEIIINDLLMFYKVEFDIVIIMVKSYLCDIM